MINRKEITRFIQLYDLTDTIDLVWRINCTAVPNLSKESAIGNDCRFSLAEHIIHKFFETRTAQELPEGALQAFCEHFQASALDIATATERTRQDYGMTGVADADVATTLIWLWFCDASRAYGTYEVELKFLLYTLVSMSKDDAELKQAGLENLTRSVKTKPSLFFRLLNCLGGRAYHE